MKLRIFTIFLLCAALCGATAQGAPDDTLTGYLSEVCIPAYGLAQRGECGSLDDMCGLIDGIEEDLDGDGQCELITVRTERSGDEFVIYLDVYSPDTESAGGVRLRGSEQWRSVHFGCDPWDTRMGLCTFTLDGTRCIGLYTLLIMNDTSECFHVYRLSGNSLEYVEGVNMYSHYNSAQFFTTNVRPEDGAIFYYFDMSSWTLAAGGYAEGDDEPDDEEYRAQLDEVLAAYGNWLAQRGLSRVDWRLLDSSAASDFTTRDKFMPDELINGDGLSWICHLSAAQGFDTDAGRAYMQLETGALSGLIAG